ncbi:unnamed protein product [Closterium sp. Naga37s-1]|nr:unnamed protein product [Closterium sp. Naga37s-1]
MGSSQRSVVAPLSPYLAALALSSPVLSVNDEDTNSEDGSTLLSPALASPAAPIFRCRFRTPLFGCVALDAVQREVRGRRELAERGALQAQREGQRGRKQQEGKQTATQDRRRPAQEGGRGRGIDQQRQGAEAAADGEDAARISHDLAMFVGGPIWAVDWCPLPRYSHTQYLAVACHPHLRPFSPLGVPLSGPALVQVWAAEEDEEEGKEGKEGAEEEEEREGVKGRQRGGRRVGEGPRHRWCWGLHTKADSLAARGGGPWLAGETAGQAKEERGVALGCWRLLWEMAPWQSITCHCHSKTTPSGKTGNSSSRSSTKVTKGCSTSSRMSRRHRCSTQLRMARCSPCSPSSNGSPTQPMAPPGSPARSHGRWIQPPHLSPHHAPHIAPPTCLLPASRMVPSVLVWRLQLDHLTANTPSAHSAPTAAQAPSGSKPQKPPLAPAARTTFSHSPILSFRADSGLIRSLAWLPTGPLPPKLLEEGLEEKELGSEEEEEEEGEGAVDEEEESTVLIVGGQSGILKFWDLRDVFQPAYETPTISRHGVLQLHFCTPLRALVMAMEDGSLRVLAMRSSLSHHPALPFPLNQQQQQQGRQEHKEEKNRYNRRWVVSTLSLSTAAVWGASASDATGCVAFGGADGSVRCVQVCVWPSAPVIYPPSTFSLCSSRQLSNNFLINRHSRSKQAVITVGGFNQILPPPAQSSTEADTSADESFEHRFVFFRGGSSEEIDGEAGQKGKGKLKKGRRDGGEEAEVEEEGGHTAEYGGGVVCGNALGCKAVAMHRVAWNANRGFQQWLASGGANGVLRCQLFHLPSDG